MSTILVVEGHAISWVFRSHGRPAVPVVMPIPKILGDGSEGAGNLEIRGDVDARIGIGRQTP